MWKCYGLNNQVWYFKPKNKEEAKIFVNELKEKNFSKELFKNNHELSKKNEWVQDFYNCLGIKVLCDILQSEIEK
jgi:alpha-galactosidase/6-phospho-beta-glucosidase family protein